MKETIVQRYTGSFDGYVPPLIGNGDIGGTFDAFCGTWFDELRSVPNQKEDIRTLLHARFIAQDYWELTCVGQKAPRAGDWTGMFLENEPGKLNSSSVTRGSPFCFYIGPVDKEFPAGVHEHEQRLDIEQGLLNAQYKFKGKCYQVECFIHPSRSLLAYRIRAGGPMEFRIAAPRPMPEVGPEKKLQLNFMGVGLENVKVYADGDALMVESVSNIFSPGVAAVWSDRGRIQGNKMKLPSGESVLYVAYGHTALKKPKEQISAALDYARRKGYDFLRKEHVKWWEDFWGRSDISVPDERMQQMYYRSLYYLGCSLARRTKTPSFEAGISGSFPTFQTGYHIQDSVYHVLPMYASNHLELIEPMLEWYLDVLPIAKENARSVYWLDGARYIWHGGPGMLPYIPGHTHFGCCSHEHHVNAWVVLAIERYLNACAWNKDKVRRYYPVVSEIARFFSSMLIPKGDGKFEIRYLPVHSQGEGSDLINQPNTFDVLAAAKWCLRVAAQMSRLIGADAAEARRWKKEAEGIDFSPLHGRDGSYLVFEGHKDEQYKVCAQFIGVIMPLGLDKQRLLATYKAVQKYVIFGSCAWDPGFVAMTLARLKETEMAGKHLSRMFTDGYTEDPWIMFRESAPFWLNAKKGNMPYFMGAHGLYAQAIHEMLLQNWSGKTELFPACPFENASFRLRAGNKIVAARKQGAKIIRGR